MLAFLMGPLSIVGFLWFLIYLALVLVCGWLLLLLLGKFGITVPEKLLWVVGFVVVILLLIMLIQGGIGAPTFR